MYPLTRLLLTGLKAFRASPLDAGGVAETSFRCRPWDLDMFMEMNNGRVLTLYDLGRFDLSIRTGLAKVLKRKRWGLAVAGASVRYRKRIRIFDKVTMRTQVLGFDDRWIFLGQSMWVNDKPVSSLLVRTCVTEAGTSLPTEQIQQAMSIQDWKPLMPGWVEAWHQADQTRPWPPVP
ncbi:MAG: acyl-CoA thioesterase [Rhizobiales bacterium]|nr:acyl-CoA thioesterase [Hyphomicrobiales bacterium]